MAWDEKDLKCTQAEHDFLSGKLSGIPGWDANTVPWKQIGADFFFIPESVSGSNGQPDVVLKMAKQILSEMPPAP